MIKLRIALLLSSLVVSGLAMADLSKGLVAYYPFNGDANDESGNGNNGQVNGATLAEDRSGNQNSAYFFDGGSNYIQLSNSDSLNVGLGNYSIAAWIKVISPTHNGRIFSKGSNNWSTGYMMRMNNNIVYLENAFQGKGKVTLQSSKSLADDNKWHLVVGVVDRGAGAKIYIDGTLNASQTIDTSTYDLSNTNDPMIGYNDQHDKGEYFHGSIDEVRLYKRALSQSEILQLYRISNQVSGTVAGYSKLSITCSNQTSGQTVTFNSTNTKVSSWNCEKNGLLVNPGDQVDVMLSGKAH